MTVYEKYEIEKDEDNLIGSLANINQSIKSKDKNLFLENISDFYKTNLIQYRNSDYNSYTSEKELKKDSIKNKNLTSPPKEKVNQKLINNKINTKNNEIPNTVSNRKTSKEENILYSCPRSFSFESIQNIDINFNEIGKKLDILEIKKKSNKHSLKEKGNNPFNQLFQNPIFSQNILPTEDTLKLFMIGDDSVGKSFFIEKFLKRKWFNKGYKKTESMEIYKNMVHLINKTVKMEIYDTNKQILDSLMFKSNFNKN